MLSTWLIVFAVWALCFIPSSFSGVDGNNWFFVTNLFVSATPNSSVNGRQINSGGRDVIDGASEQLPKAFSRRTGEGYEHERDRYSYDGSGNNLEHPQWGAKGEGRIRSFVQSNNYNDSTGIPFTSPNLPSPANIMIELFSRITPANVMNARNRNRLNPSTCSQLLVYFGEFITRDISVSSTNHSDPMPIQCPTDNETLTSGVSLMFCPPGRTSHPFFRSPYADGYDAEHPRAPVNTRSAFLDLSNLYGHEEETVRKYRSGSGGELALSPNGLPLRDNETGHFMMYDYMTRSNPGLLSLATVFARYHNVLARRLAEIDEDADDELLFQRARMENIAVYQNIVEEKYLPIVLGDTLDPYVGYDSTVDPSVDVFFTTVGFRYGHSAISGNVRVLDKNYKPIPQYDPLLLREIFENMEAYVDVLSQVMPEGDETGSTTNSTGIEPFLRGLSAELEKDVDISIVPDLNTYTQLVSTYNIQRGRDHGMPSYNGVREALGLTRFESFEELVEDFGGESVDPNLANILDSLYNGDIDLMDAFVGCLLETEYGFETNALVGNTMGMSIREQFARIRNGDRFWYKNRYLPEHIREFPSLSQIIKTVFPEGEMENFPDDPFLIFDDDNDNDDDEVCADASLTSLSLLNGAYTARWELHEDNNEIDLIITVGEQVEGGFIGIGWGAHIMFGSTIWYCTDNTDIDRNYLPTCDNTNSEMSNATLESTVFSCCVAPGQNHLAPVCYEEDEDGYYEIYVVHECFSEETTSVTIRAPICSGNNTNSTTQISESTSSDDGNDEVVSQTCLSVDGPIEMIAAYSPSSISRPHGSGRRAFSTIEVTGAGVIADTVAYSDDGFYALHGITMLGCWMVLAPLAVFVVRYMKHHVWFLFVHVTLMTACGSVTFPMMLGALVTAIERQASLHRWIGVMIVVLFPFISGTGAIRRFSLEGNRSLGKFDRYVFYIHRTAGWFILIFAFWNCYMGLVRIGPLDSYIEFMSVDSIPVGYDIPIFGHIQRYIFWPYVALVVIVFAVAEAYRGHAFDSFKKYRANAGIWGNMDLSTLDPMTSTQFNEATHYGKQICIVDGCVLDISDFLDRHPGGKRIMRFAAGTDITLELLGKRSVDGMYHPHSPFAFQRLKTLVIARLEVEKSSGARKAVERISFAESVDMLDSGSFHTRTDTKRKKRRSRDKTPGKAGILTRTKDIFRRSDTEAPAIFVTAHIESYNKITPLVSTTDKPVIQLFVLVPKVSNSDSNISNSPPKVERVTTAAPGSVCVIRLRDANRGDIIERSQTPVRVQHLTNGDVIYEFFISLVPGGKMSTALLNMKKGKALLLRRPNVDEKLIRKINSKVWPVVLLLASGTGLSPILQVIDYLLDSYSKVASTQQGLFTVARTQIFLVWTVRNRDYNYFDVCGMNERVERSKGTFKWMIVYAKPNDEHKENPTAGVKQRTRNHHFSVVQRSIMPAYGKRQSSILNFGAEKRLGDICDDVSTRDTSSSHFTDGLKPLNESDKDWWNGGYFRGRLELKMLSTLLARTNSASASASRASTVVAKRVSEIGIPEDKEESTNGESDGENRAKSPLQVDLETGKWTRASVDSKSTTVDVGNYDNVLVGVSGRPKFEDECWDNLLMLGIKEDNIMRFTDLHG